MEVYKYILKNRKILTILSISTLTCSIIVLSVPILISFFHLKEKNILDKRAIIFISLSMLFSLIMQCFIIVLREKTSVKINVENSIELYRRMFKLNYQQYTKLGATYLLDRISGLVNSIYIFICTTLSSIISNFIIVVLCIVIVFYYNVYLSLLLFIILPINYYGYRKLNKKLAEKSIEMQKITSRGYQSILSLISNPDFIKQYSDYPNINIMIEKELNKIFVSIKNVNVFAQSMSTLLKFLNIYVQNIIIFVISYEVFNNNKSVAPVIVISIILPIYFNAINSITNSNIDTHELRSGLKFVEDDLNEKFLEEFSNRIVDRISLIKIDKDIICQNGITFKIDGDFEFKLGDVVYVSGISGSGKSTLLRSIATFLQNNYIKFNEYFLSELNIVDLRKRIIYVSQDSTVLPMSIYENLQIADYKNDSINYNVEGIDNSRLKDKIYENGKNLSGGEKQRISVARALINKPEVLLLDEITSNIDENSSKQIYSNIINQASERITFITSHDTSVRRFCNKEIRVTKLKIEDN